MNYLDCLPHDLVNKLLFIPCDYDESYKINASTSKPVCECKRVLGDINGCLVALGLYLGEFDVTSKTLGERRKIWFCIFLFLSP